MGIVGFLCAKLYLKMTKIDLSEAAVIAKLAADYPLNDNLRRQAEVQALSLLTSLHQAGQQPGLGGISGRLLNLYDLGEPQGLSLLELAEAYLRTPDQANRIALIKDKIASQEWLGPLSRPAPNLGFIERGAAYGLTGLKYLASHDGTKTHQAIHKLGLRASLPLVHWGLKFMAKQFVLAETIASAYKRAQRVKQQSFSFDMLGEAARTQAMATEYFNRYRTAILYASKISSGAHLLTPQQNKYSISVKLSALAARYETLQQDETLSLLYERLSELLRLCKVTGLGLTIDAEEDARLELSLLLINRLLKSGICRDWQGLSIVVQAYNKKSPRIVDSLLEMVQKNNSLLGVRLVKGAYWDSEIKVAQIKGLSDFPLFTLKNNSDLAYITLARQLLDAAPQIYPQFGTHNVFSVAAISQLVTKHKNKPDFEFQRLHGMGAALYNKLSRDYGYSCRIYAPVGRHEDLLAYLMRRLLENGANSSFVHQFATSRGSWAELVRDPYNQLCASKLVQSRQLRTGAELFLPARPNSRGCDLDNPHQLQDLLKQRARFKEHKWHWDKTTAKRWSINNPTNLKDQVGSLAATSSQQLKTMVKQLQQGQEEWQAVKPPQRAALLNRVADLYEANQPELLALLAREAGRTLQDALDEVREAVDFCRYYAHCGQQLPSWIGGRGLVLCISPWNFPLAIFTGQILAGLMAGNSVLAKPAEQTPLIARRAIALMHLAGIPQKALNIAFISGEETSKHLIKEGKVDMVVFTGSNLSAKIIEHNIIASPKPGIPFIAETGGINAMIIDSTALIESAVDDVVTSAFGSCGQRCSALRVVYVQEEIRTAFLYMLCGALEALKIGPSWEAFTDLGSLIDSTAHKHISGYLKSQKDKIIYRTNSAQLPGQGYFIAPGLIEVTGIKEVPQEIFGPVLHVAAFHSKHLGQVIEDINSSGYGLTFGVHSRLGKFCQQVSSKINAGNVYINRNQIGAVVGSQPFGGQGLSGTGPKAGGPLYLAAFSKYKDYSNSMAKKYSKYLKAPQLLAGPAGENNSYQIIPRGRVLCCGGSKQELIKYCKRALAYGAKIKVRHPKITLADFKDQPTNYSASSPSEATQGPSQLRNISCSLRNWQEQDLQDISAVIWGGAWDDNLLRLRQTLARLRADLVPFMIQGDFEVALLKEKHICTNTTAIGGNPALLALG